MIPVCEISFVADNPGCLHSCIHKNLRTCLLPVSDNSVVEMVSIYGVPKANLFLTWELAQLAFHHNNIMRRSKDFKKGGDDKNKHGFLEEYILPLANQQMVNNYLYSVTREFPALFFKVWVE